MADSYLNKTGLAYFWGKIKAWANAAFATISHTHTSYAVKHSYTTAANAAKNWYRIANANTSQLDTTKPIRAQFIVTAYNTSYAADYYETWFVNAIVFGRQAHIVIFGGSAVPFSQARILYENTVADIDANDRPAIDLYLNNVLPNGTTKIEVEEIYNNGGWTFVVDGQLAASSAPSGFESIATAPRNTGVNNSTYADYVNYLNRQISDITAAFTLADTWLYRSRTLNCTGTFTITIPSINSGYMWCVIKNKNTSSGVITLHPSTTSVLIDGSNADITLQPMEYVCIHSAGANNYSLIADGRNIGINKTNSTEDVNSLYSATAGTKVEYYTTTIGGTTLVNLPDAVNTTLESRTLRRVSDTDWNVEQICHNTIGLYYRRGNNNGWMPWKKFAFTDSSITGNAATASAVAWSGVTSKPTTISGYGITDAKIVNGTITLGSNSITPLTSVPSHNQASNTINVMTGYSKASTSAAISTSDSLNTAMGKLEYKVDSYDDSNYVHKTGDEIISGVKTFNSASIVLYEDNWSIAKHVLNFTKGTTSISHDMVGGFAVYENRNAYNWRNRLGAFDVYVGTDGLMRTSITSFLNVSESSTSTAVEVGYDANNMPYARAPRTSTTRTDEYDILTRSWIPIDTRIVHTTGNEDIEGVKTFTTSPTVFKWEGDYTIHALRLNVTKGTNPSGTGKYGVICAFEKSGNLYVANRIAALSMSVDISGNTYASLVAYKYVANGSGTSDFMTIIASDGTAYQRSNTIRPHENNKYSLGTGTYKYTAVYATNGSIQTSDERFKHHIDFIPDAVLVVWESVEWKQFRMLDSVQKKGRASARVHAGAIAQQIQKAFADAGLDASAYGFFCHDEWEQTQEIRGEEGQVLVPYNPAGDSYALRYDEALCIEAAYLRRENARLKSRVASLEERLAALEMKLS